MDNIRSLKEKVINVNFFYFDLMLSIGDRWRCQCHNSMSNRRSWDVAYSVQAAWVQEISWCKLHVRWSQIWPVTRVYDLQRRRKVLDIGCAIYIFASISVNFWPILKILFFRESIWKLQFGLILGAQLRTLCTWFCRPWFTPYYFFLLESPWFF